MVVIGRFGGVPPDEFDLNLTPSILPLRRFTIGIVVVQKADVYMFDEPSSYLDVKQRCVGMYIRNPVHHPPPDHPTQYRRPTACAPP